MVLALGILVLLRSLFLGVGVGMTFLGWLLAGPQGTRLLQGLAQRMPGYQPALLGASAVEGVLALAGVGLGIALILRWKAARWPALAWGVATALVALVPLVFLLVMVPPGHDQWWASNTPSLHGAAGILGARILSQMSWYAEKLAVSLALAVGLAWVLLSPRFNKAFPKARRKRDEDEEDH